MRSVQSPRVAHDATVEIGSGSRGRAVNLSTGGIFVAAEQPLDPGAQVHLKVNLRDGASPLDVDAEVVWRGDGGMALRFVELDDVGRRRIQRLVQKREPTQLGGRDVRIRLPELNAPLRASARELTERGLMIEAELPWLRLGSAVTAELSPDQACDGHVQWIGLDVTRSGSARLRIFIDLADEEGPGAPGALLSPAAGSCAPAEAAGRAVARDPADAADRVAPSARRGWFWPALAVTAMLTSGGLGLALLRRPPVPTLLPTAPPETEPHAPRPPSEVTVPAEGAAGAAQPSGVGKHSSRAAETSERPAATRKPAHSRKHVHATRRAD